MQSQDIFAKNHRRVQMAAMIILLAVIIEMAVKHIW